jgi:hypothetical protein
MTKRLTGQQITEVKEMAAGQHAHVDVANSSVARKIMVLFAMTCVGSDSKRQDQGYETQD